MDYLNREQDGDTFGDEAPTGYQKLTNVTDRKYAVETVLASQREIIVVPTL